MYNVVFQELSTGRILLVTANISGGESILETALEHGLQLSHECGGMASCGTCRIHVEEGNNYLEFKSKREIHCLLKNNITADGFRLACQCVLLPGNGNLVIAVPEPQNV